jgi:hypothetical protein
VQPGALLLTFTTPSMNNDTAVAAQAMPNCASRPLAPARWKMTYTHMGTEPKMMKEMKVTKPSLAGLQANDGQQARGTRLTGVNVCVGGGHVT